MQVATALLLIATMPAAADALPNFDFSSLDLSHWQGEGFQMTKAGASSREAASQAILHRAFTVPADMEAIRFYAAAIRPDALKPGPILDVYLEGAERRLIPKQVREGDSWKPVGALLPPRDAVQREYRWDLTGLEGQLVRIVLLDQDQRSGCYVACAGFHFVPRQHPPLKQFADHMLRLSREHNLGPVARFDSRHFTALSNADDDYVEHRLHNCEAIYALFYPHFRGKGFTVKEPADKLMVAILDSQAGFEAYFSRRLSSTVSGMFDVKTNRLVVYDYADNRGVRSARQKAERNASRIGQDLNKRRYLGEFNRKIASYHNDTNIGTIMHEVAHQLSFNGGLLNPEGDAPLWLVEGLACYCESTHNGNWSGIGEPNPVRAGTLAGVLNKKGKFIPLRDILSSDGWLRKKESSAALAYAQSWALFRMLMDERPADLKKYLATIYPRRTADHRLADFVSVFGHDLAGLEQQHSAYLRHITGGRR